MRKVLSISGRIVLGILVAVLLFLSVSIAPVNRTLPVEQSFYTEMMSRIDSAAIRPEETDTAALRIGFGTASITPHHPTATAGYVKRKRKLFSAIRDSVFARTMAINKEGQTYFIVSLDMLIVPPLLYKQLKEQLPASGYSIDRVLLGATHTHNSIGQWDDSLVGEIYAGDYNTDLMQFLREQIIRSMHNAVADLKPGKINYGAVAVPHAVTNRLISSGPVDSLLHILEVIRDDGTKGILTSFSAHATCLPSKDLRLSRDYPGELVDRLQTSGYTFAMFMAGAVGSHAPIREPSGDSKIHIMANLLTDAFQRASLKPVRRGHVYLINIPLNLAQQQVKLLPNWRVRSWLSSGLMGEHDVHLTVLKIGEVVMLGTPCDFSGMLTPEIYRAAAQHHEHAFITSFNGGYIGYITPDRYYDLDAYETQTMNWYGPGNGTYLQDCLIRIISNLKP